MRIKHLVSVFLVLCAGIFLAACSESTDEEYATKYGEMVDVRVKMG